MRLYLLFAVFVAIVCVYFYGINTEREKCKTKHFQDNFETITKTQQQQKVIHDTVYKTGVGDIRRILFDKYTIAE